MASIAVSKFNTALRALNTLSLLVLLSQAAHAQSVLNFPKLIHADRLKTGIAVTNPTPYYSDVQFTFYGLDGNALSAGVVNPVSYRIGPNSQLSMMADEFFAAGNLEGWIQATSSTSGLQGYYSVGDFDSTGEGSQSAVPLSSQVIPFLREDANTRTDLFIINPGSTPADAAITFYNARGEEIGTVIRNLPAHAATRFPMSSLSSAAGAGNISAKISSSVPAVAMASVETANTHIVVNGQRTDQPAASRIAPHFTRSGAFDSSLILSNPASSPATVTVTLFSESGGAVYQALPGPSSVVVTIPANGSVSLDSITITRFPFLPAINGWLRIDSANVPLAGVVLVDSQTASAAIPLQAGAASSMLFAQLTETETFFSAMILVNDGAEAADVEISLLNPDGATFARNTVPLSAKTKLSSLIRDLVPGASGVTNGYVWVRSSVPIHGVQVLGGFENQFLTAVTPRVPPVGQAPGPVVAAPRIINIAPSDSIRPGTTLLVVAVNVAGEASLSIAGHTVPLQLSALGFYTFVVPPVEPGFARVRVRSGGLESDPVEVQVLPADNRPAQVIQGQAFYQKVEVTDAGLDLSRPVMVPVRNARVEVFDRLLQAVAFVSETDARGRFHVPAPSGQPVTIRVISRLRSVDLVVADNTNNSSLYTISADIDMRDAPSNILLIDNTRVSGAFNILEAVQRGNDTVRLADPRTAPLPLTIFWSIRNAPRNGSVREGAVGMTHFDLNSGTAFIVGDRSIDSDEFDDSVILHEYAHLLAARFSRDESPGGPHRPGDMLDPRLAWSEGFANFFSGAARNDHVYRDSSGPDGSRILRYDLEENIPAGDRPGYWSEASVQSLLWDFYDEAVDTGDEVRFPLSLIWASFSDLRNDRFVYLPYFLDRFIERAPVAAETIRLMVQLRSIDFQPNVRPSVTNPFPRPIAAGDAATGEVDSLSSKRKNLMQASHFFAFTTGGGPSSIRLDIAGLGQGGNSDANDLDLFLMDINGRIVERSDRGLNGQSELISTELRAGTYVIEVRSYYTLASTNTIVYNSGAYRLRLLGP
jgi:hypothetical protein